MVHQVEYQGQIHEFPDEATPEMMAEALGISQPAVSNVPASKRILQQIKEQASIQKNTGAWGLPKIPLTKNFINSFIPKSESISDIKNRFKKQNFGDLAKGATQGVLNAIPETLNLPIDIGNYFSGGNNPRIPTFNFAPNTKASQLGQILPMLFAPELAGKNIPGKIGKAASNLTPSGILSKTLKSPLTEQELLRNLEATKGTATGLGDVIGSPTLKGLQENVISKIPFSGYEAGLHKTTKTIAEKGNNLVNQYLGENNPDEISDLLGKSLINAKNINRVQKNKFYKIPENIADQSGFKLKLDKFKDLANQHINDIKSSNILQFQPDVKSLLSKLDILKEPVKTETVTGKILNPQGEPLINKEITTAPTVKEANILAARLKDLADQHGQSLSLADRNAARVLGGMSRTLKSELKEEIMNSGNKKLIDSFNEAEKNYAENYSQFLDRDIHKFTTGRKLPEDLVASFLINSRKSDKSGQLEKLMKTIPEKDHDLIRYSYFSRALEGPEEMRHVNPNKLKTLWNALGPKQKKLLIPNQQHRQSFEDYVSLVEKNPRAVYKMVNPLTGQVNNSLLTGYMLMNPKKSLKEMILGNLGQRQLSSEKAREKIVKGIIQRRNQQ